MICPFLFANDSYAWTFLLEEHCNERSATVQAKDTQNMKEIPVNSNSSSTFTVEDDTPKMMNCCPWKHGYTEM